MTRAFARWIAHYLTLLVLCLGVLALASCSVWIDRLPDDERGRQVYRVVIEWGTGQP